MQNYYENDEKITNLNSNDNLNDNEIVKLKDTEFDKLIENEFNLKDNEKMLDNCNLEKIEFVENVKKFKIKNELIQQKLDVIDYNNNLIEINKNEFSFYLKTVKIITNF